MSSLVPDQLFHGMVFPPPCLFKGKIASGGVLVFFDREIPFALRPMGTGNSSGNQFPQ